MRVGGLESPLRHVAITKGRPDWFRVDPLSV